MRAALTVVLAGVFSIFCGPATAQDAFSHTVVLEEKGFPTVDSSAPAGMQTMLKGAHFVSARDLDERLKDSSIRLLILPYGSAFPEQSWSEIFAYLRRGGNLLVLGGRPFTRSAYRAPHGWEIRDYSVRFTRPLMIDQYQPSPGSDGLDFQSNPNLPVKIPPFHWRQAFSPIIRLSSVDVYKREGSAGSIDSRLDALAWGMKDGRKLSAPVIEIDHLRNGFDGGRWIFVNSEVSPDFFSTNNAESIRMLAERAAEGSQEFTVRPVLPLYLPGETPELEVQWNAAQPATNTLSAKISVFPEQQPSDRFASTVALPAVGNVIVPPSSTKGLHLVEAQVTQGDRVVAIYHSAFWIRDEDYLRSGPKLTVNQDYFELDGKPMAVVGTTYMSSEVQRLFFDHPNVYVWDRDLAHIHAAGLNMIRTGWWTGWDKFCDENGMPYERTLRTMEAYLMTARRYGIPVQFNFFAFTPDSLGGMNSYLDPAAVERQKALITSIVARFHDVPWLAWDLLNEPSISEHLWTMRPNGDSFELAAWNDWLNKRYSDHAALAAAWNVPASSLSGTIALPEEIEFTQRGTYAGHNSLKVYDFYMFAQDVFCDWVKTMRDAIRTAGSQQLITIGQDEGGIQDRPSPAFWGPLVNFTTNHSWWQVDHNLWTSLLAKQPGETMLIQETGVQRELNLTEDSRRTPQNEADLLERKVAASFIQGAGAIEWLWNTNSYMTESNETPIGAVLPDGTEKSDAVVLRRFSEFAKALGPHLVNPQCPSIAIITSQAAQYSIEQGLQLEAQRKAVRALAYYDRLPAYAVAENQIEKLGVPKLAILPSPQALSEKTWNSLLAYVNAGGTLLITGPVERDEHWQGVSRISQLKAGGKAEPLTYHNAIIRLKDRSIPLTFDQTAQIWLEALRFYDGTTLKELALGSGHIFWAAYPVELAEGDQPAADLYSYVAARAGITPEYDLQSAISPGVLIYPTVLEDSVFYVMISENADDTKIDLRDKLIGVRLTISLKSQRAALAIISKRDKSVVAKYGF